MNIVKISLAFARLPAGDLILFANHVHDSMTGNSSFPSPTPALTVLASKVAAFEDAATAAQGGGTALTAAKNEAQEALVSVLRSLAYYVQEECDNNLSMLLSSGYEAVKPRTPAGVLPAPQSVTLTKGTLGGSLNLRGAALTNAGGYEGQMTMNLSGPTVWETIGLFTAPRMTLEDLTPGAVYWARLRGIGSEGPGAWSEPVSARVL